MLTSTLKISGPDAETFLQGQCTCDVTQLGHEKTVFSACCNRKGRMIANFWIWREAEHFYLQLPEVMQGKLATHLQTYMVFSKAKIETIENMNAPIEKISFTPIWILPETSEQFTPQMIDLQKHGGVSFTKGCYLGQEIIARMEHLGTLKRHCYRITIDNDASPNVGDEITNTENQKVGMIAAVNEKEIFAVIEARAIEQRLQWKHLNVNKLNLRAQ